MFRVEINKATLSEPLPELDVPQALAPIANVAAQATATAARMVFLKHGLSMVFLLSFPNLVGLGSFQLCFLGSEQGARNLESNHAMEI
ncbi:hypothetical protein AB4920_00720 [Bifidobacterium dentium]|uniref:hypothetical protein n=1 Tax=Bifidobacterium dentium TaxID=1689 RepID=UPI003D183186